MVDAIGPASYALRSTHPDPAFDGLPLLVFVSISRSEILRGWSHLAFVIIFAVVVLSGGLVALTLLLAQQVHRKLQVDRQLLSANALLAELGTSHIRFFNKNTPVPGRNSINATFKAWRTDDGERWLFQDIQPGGPADQAGI